MPNDNKVTIPRWGIVLAVVVAVLIVGGVAVALIEGGDDSDRAPSTSTRATGSTSTTSTTKGSAATPTSPSQGGTSTTLATTTSTTSTTKPLSPVTGLAPVVSGTGHHFGMVPVGTTSGDWPIVISNPNTVPIEISITGGASAPPFDGSAGTCGGNSLILAPGGSCMMTYNFTPTVAGSVAGSTGITVTVVSSNASQRYDITFAGIGV